MWDFNKSKSNGYANTCRNELNKKIRGDRDKSYKQHKWGREMVEYLT